MIDRIQDTSNLMSNLQRLIISPSVSVKKYKDKDLYKIWVEKEKGIRDKRKFDK